MFSKMRKILYFSPSNTPIIYLHLVACIIFLVIIYMEIVSKTLLDYRIKASLGIPTES